MAVFINAVPRSIWKRCLSMFLSTRLFHLWLSSPALTAVFTMFDTITCFPPHVAGGCATGPKVMTAGMSEPVAGCRHATTCDCQQRTFCYLGISGAGPWHHGAGWTSTQKSELSVLGRCAPCTSILSKGSSHVSDLWRHERWTHEHQTWRSRCMCLEVEVNLQQRVEDVMLSQDINDAVVIESKCSVMADHDGASCLRWWQSSDDPSRQFTVTPPELLLCKRLHDPGVVSGVAPQ